MRAIKFLPLILLLAISLLGATSAQALTTRFSLTDLGTLGGRYSFAMGLNNNGQVVGYSSDGFHERAFLWQSGSMHSLGTLEEGSTSRALDINESGTVTGWSTTDGHGTHAFIWTESKAMRDMNVRGEATARGFAINNSTEVTGAYLNDLDQERAYYWEGGHTRSLATLGGDFGEGHDINDLGQIVGISDTGSSAHAFLQQADGTVQDLGTLGGDYSEALGINEAGEVVGFSETEDAYHAFLWRPGSGFVDLDAVNGNRTSLANDINESGMIVGETNTPSGTHAVLWDSDLHKHDLNGLVDASGAGWELTSATAINDSGMVVGYGWYDGHTRAFLLTPYQTVPEPSTYLSLGLGGLWLLRKRRLR